MAAGTPATGKGTLATGKGTLATGKGTLANSKRHPGKRQIAHYSPQSEAVYEPLGALGTLGK